jgi:prepilin-type N-terminal cleavage/methylation domain-containing protein
MVAGYEVLITRAQGRTGEVHMGSGVRKPQGFTLIELLIVVAIIAILAAIAVPNFLEAQVRAKVSRARADMRTLATALESYAVDHNKYPPNFPPYNVPPPEVSTPIAYISNAKMVDPFSDKERVSTLADPELARFYTYTFIVTISEVSAHTLSGRNPPREGIDGPIPFFNLGALNRYGPWRLVSNGPDRVYSFPASPPPLGPFNPTAALLGADIPYDPTNGTVSNGNLLRTHKKGDEPVP